MELRTGDITHHTLLIKLLSPPQKNQIKLAVPNCSSKQRKALILFFGKEGFQGLTRALVFPVTQGPPEEQLL